MLNTNTTLTFEQVPGALGELLEDVRCLKAALINGDADQNGAKNNKKDVRIPVGVERASEITGKAKNTLYRYTSRGLIPHMKVGKKLYFYEDELISWLESGKCETLEEQARRTERTILQLRSKGGI